MNNTPDPILPSTPDPSTMIPVQPAVSNGPSGYSLTQGQPPGVTPVTAAKKRKIFWIILGVFFGGMFIIGLFITFFTITFMTNYDDVMELLNQG